MMEFLVAAAEAGIGDGVRSISPVKRSKEAEVFIRMSSVPVGLRLITDLLRSPNAEYQVMPNRQASPDTGQSMDARCRAARGQNHG